MILCIITATALTTLATATLAALTPDYEVLTNQGDAPVSVYIDSVALQLNLSHYSNEYKILYVLRALNTTPLCYLVIQTLISERAQISNHSIPSSRAKHDSDHPFISYYDLSKDQEVRDYGSSLSLYTYSSLSTVFTKKL
jgi:hypothetical protein